jgi:hypothetical protein
MCDCFLYVDVVPVILHACVLMCMYACVVHVSTQTWLLVGVKSMLIMGGVKTRPEKKKENVDPPPHLSCVLDEVIHCYYDGCVMYECVQHCWLMCACVW